MLTQSTGANPKREVYLLASFTDEEEEEISENESPKVKKKKKKAKKNRESKGSKRRSRREVNGLYEKYPARYLRNKLLS